MENPQFPDSGEDAVHERFVRLSARRGFLKWSGAAAGAAFLAACQRAPTEPDDDISPTLHDSAAQGQVTINLGNDIGILNFAYALEQLEAAFYTRVVLHGFYPRASGEETRILASVKNHEVVHREFFRVALGSAAIPKLAVNLSSVDLDSRASVLGTAKALEDTGVGAYNGAAQFLRNGDYLVVAGKIVSVEARHASAIRDVFGSSFAPSAFDQAFTFEQVLSRAGPFIATPIKLTNSPTAGSGASLSASSEEVTS